LAEIGELLVVEAMGEGMLAGVVVWALPGPGGPARLPAARAGLSRCASSRLGTGVSPLTGFHP